MRYLKEKHPPRALHLSEQPLVEDLHKEGRQAVITLNMIFDLAFRGKVPSTMRPKGAPSNQKLFQQILQLAGDFRIDNYRHRDRDFK